MLSSNHAFLEGEAFDLWIKPCSHPISGLDGYLVTSSIGKLQAFPTENLWPPGLTAFQWDSSECTFMAVIRSDVKNWVAPLLTDPSDKSLFLWTSEGNPQEPGVRLQCCGPYSSEHAVESLEGLAETDCNSRAPSIWISRYGDRAELCISRKFSDVATFVGLGTTLWDHYYNGSSPLKFLHLNINRWGGTHKTVHNCKTWLTKLDCMTPDETSF